MYSGTRSFWARAAIEVWLARQEVPARLGPRAVVPLQKGRFLRLSQRGLSSGLMLKAITSKSLPASSDRGLRPRVKPRKKLAAEQRAAVIDRRQDHGPAAEVIAERQLSARFISKVQGERELGSQLLVEARLGP